MTLSNTAAPRFMQHAPCASLCRKVGAVPSLGCQEGVAASAAGGDGQSERRYARALGVPSGARVGLHVALPLAAARDGSDTADRGVGVGWRDRLDVALSRLREREQAPAARGQWHSDEHWDLVDAVRVTLVSAAASSAAGVPRRGRGGGASETE